MASGIVFDIRRHALHDGPGIRTVFFFKGCPLSCAWCHNPEGLAFEPGTARRPERCVACGSCREIPVTHSCPSGAIETMGVERLPGELTAIAAKDEAYYRESGGGVTFSGGEPLAQPEFLFECLEACGELGLRTAVDTSGFAEKEVVRTAASMAGLFLYDLKLMDPERHLAWTGVTNAVILENLEELARADADCIVSVPVIPGVNDDENNMRETARFISGLGKPWPVRLLPWHDGARSKYARHGMVARRPAFHPPTDVSLAAIAKSFGDSGIRTTIGGLS